MVLLHSFLTDLERICLTEQFLFYENVFLSNLKPLSFAGLQRDLSRETAQVCQRIRGKTGGKKSGYHYASGWSNSMGCRRSPSFFRSSVTVQVRSDPEIVPNYPCFSLHHRLVLGCVPQIAEGGIALGLPRWLSGHHKSGHQRKLNVMLFHLYAYIINLASPC